MYVVNPFSGLKLLHFLSLDFNRILQVPQNVFEEVHNLKSLHLEYNHINYLNESSFNGLQGMWNISNTDKYALGMAIPQKISLLG